MNSCSLAMISIVPLSRMSVHRVSWHRKAGLEGGFSNENCILCVLLRRKGEAPLYTRARARAQSHDLERTAIIPTKNYSDLARPLTGLSRTRTRSAPSKCHHINAPHQEHLEVLKWNLRFRTTVSNRFLKHSFRMLYNSMQIMQVLYNNFQNESLSPQNHENHSNSTSIPS